VAAVREKSAIFKIFKIAVSISCNFGALNVVFGAQFWYQLKAWVPGF
jgi:hypothetical protein